MLKAWLLALWIVFQIPAFASPPASSSPLVLADAMRAMTTLNPSERAVLTALENFRAANLACENLLVRTTQPRDLEKNLEVLLPKAPSWLTAAIDGVVVQHKTLSPDQIRRLETHVYSSDVMVAVRASVRREARDLQRDLEQALLQTAPSLETEPAEWPFRIVVSHLKWGTAPDHFTLDLTVRMDRAFGSARTFKIKNLPIGRTLRFERDAVQVIMALAQGERIFLELPALRRELFVLRYNLIKLNAIKSDQTVAALVQRLDQEVATPNLDSLIGLYLEIKRMLVQRTPLPSEPPAHLGWLEWAWLQDPFYLITHPWYVGSNAITIMAPYTLLATAVGMERPPFTMDPLEVQHFDAPLDPKPGIAGLEMIDPWQEPITVQDMARWSDQDWTKHAGQVLIFQQVKVHERAQELVDWNNLKPDIQDLIHQMVTLSHSPEVVAEAYQNERRRWAQVFYTHSASPEKDAIEAAADKTARENIKDGVETGVVRLVRSDGKVITKTFWSAQTADTILISDFDKALEELLRQNPPKTFQDLRVFHYHPGLAPLSEADFQALRRLQAILSALGVRIPLHMYAVTQDPSGHHPRIFHATQLPD